MSALNILRTSRPKPTRLPNITRRRWISNDTELIRAARNYLLNLDSSASASALESAAKYESIRKQKTVLPLKLNIEKYDQLSSLACELKTIAENDPDTDMREIARTELGAISEETMPTTITELKENLIKLISPRPMAYSQSALVEIKAGVGGIEAAHFATLLMSLYTRLATRKRWQIKPVSVEHMHSGQGQDGLREAVLEIEGPDVYGSLRWEAGVHRVQRIPFLQTTCAIHTSTASVIVLPLSPPGSEKNVEENLFEEKDLRLETMRAQGAGGQHVNKTESAVRLTHIPTGTVVMMQDSRSQHQNRERAYMILRARLLDLKLRQKVIENRENRLSQVKNSNRSEKIRTYNFPQGRVTDHRIGLTLPRLNDIVEGGEQ
ncbi:hypothetical protein PSHT_06547 [Puccinia striiformis]|uniref:Prokaryotic-type class I peptide chain release factors domain-containing protein n=2 Tax=Puccinia striiformis TaxID=27350 RepID=A0A2S4W591_9BASI|nr:hypothetical protein PSTT_02095 [Puccinia striiformis]POW16952.1 hypothetical protein PSHT_06547 [Puccinia striiformis]